MKMLNVSSSPHTHLRSFFGHPEPNDRTRDIMNGNVAQIDYSKCVNCGKCAEKCPAKVIN